MRPALHARSRVSKRSIGVIGGQVIGQPGPGFLSTYTCSDGDDFTTLDLVGPATPNGAYFTTRATYSGSGNMRTPATGSLSPNVYVDPQYTGNGDANRGVPMPWDSLGATPPHSIIFGEGTGALRLMSGRQSTAEKALLNGGTNPERTAMIASLGRIVYQAPCVIEARLRYTGSAPGWHPAFWNYTTKPNQGNTGNEYGFEGNSTAFTAYHDDHTGGAPASNPGTLLLPAGTGHDGGWHTHTVIMTSTYWSFLIDGVEVNRIGTGINFSGSNASQSGWTPANHALPDFFMLTNPAYSTLFYGDNYSPSAWLAATAGMTCDCEWWRVWYPTATGHHFTPQIASSVCDQQFTSGQNFSVTLPSAATLWGSTQPTSQNVIGVQVEVEEPGSNNTTGFSTTTGLPSWCTLTGLVLSGTIPGNSGRTHFKIDPVQSGCTGRPYRFRFDVAPVFVGATTTAFTNGSPGQSYDLYAAWDCGRLIGTSGGTAGKSLTATGLPTGMSLGSNGVISGTPTTNSAFSVTVGCTNSAGQTSSQTVTMTVSAAAGPVSPPTLTSATLVGYWDPNDSTKITSVSGKVTNFTPTGVTANASNTFVNASTGPTVVARVDGNGATKQALEFLTASTNYLSIASNMGVTGACTIVEVVEMITNNTTQSHLDIANAGSSFNQNRLTVLNSSTLGSNPRKIDSVPNSCSAGFGTLLSTGAGNLHLIVSRFNAGAGANCTLNQGTQAAVTGTPVSNFPTSLNATTWGATNESGAHAKYANKRSFGLGVWTGYASDSELVSAVQTWVATNFGTLAS